jgi:hypothetical protein
MADVYMTVWRTAGEVALGDAEQHLSATIDGAKSAPVTPQHAEKKYRKRVRLFATAACWVKWGENPTATGATDSMALGAENPEYVDIESGHVLHAIARV